MAIKFSQFNLRTDHTSGMYLVGYDGNQNIHITVDNLFDDFINGTENTIAMFGTDGTVLADSILSQDAGATLLTVAGQLNVDAAATFDTNVTVTGDTTLNGNVTLGNASTDLITQNGTLYLNGPVKDTTDTLGAVDQVLLSDATGELTFTDLADLHVGGTEVVEVPVKNVQGSALVKGDPVYISGSVGASGRLEVQLADASNTLKMPAVGLLKQDLADQAEGFAVVTGKLRNLITDPIDGVNPTENDVIYVKPLGTSGAALTTTKPVYGNFIQNIGKVGRVSTAADGNFVVSSILRTNDIPNLTPGRLWIGSNGNTIESQTLFVDEANGKLGIGTTTPDQDLTINGGTESFGLQVSESDRMTMGADADWNYIKGKNGNGFKFSTFGAGDVLTLTNAGNVGIGTTSPSRIFTVSRDNTSSISASFVSANNQSAITLSGSGTTSDTQVRLAAEGNDMLMYAGNSERMRIDSSGDLNIVNTGQASLNFTTNGSSDYGRITGGKSGSGVGDLRFFTYSGGIAERMRITSAGYVGIGTTNPLRPLHVNGAATNFVAEFQSTDDKASILIQDDDTLNYIHSQDGYLSLGGQNQLSNDNLNINSSNGNIGIGTTLPDTKLHISATNAAITNPLSVGNILRFTDDDPTQNNGQITGTIEWETKDSDNAGIQSYITTVSTNTGLGNLAFGTGTGGSPIERMRIDSSGNVGIGTTLPSQNLHIYDSSGGATLKIESNTANAYDSSKIELIGGNLSTGEIIFGDPTDSDVGKIIYRHDGNSLAFNVNADEKMRIDSAGNVGIGGTTLTGWANKQVVLDSGSDVSAAFVMVNDTTGRTGTDGSVITLSGSDMYLIQRESANMIFRTANTERMRIDSSGYIGINTSSPGANLDVNGQIRLTSAGQELQFANHNVGAYRDTNNRLVLAGYNGIDFNAESVASGMDSQTRRMRIKPSGQIQFDEYGSGSFTGTAAKTLAVDTNGNVIETTNTSIDGSGTANYVTKWLDTDTITNSVIYDDGTDVGIGTATPNSKLQVDGAVQVADDTDTASADKVGALRYRTSGNNSYVDMCMQTGASTYAWINIVQNNW